MIWNIGAVVVGATTWAVLWLAGNAGLAAAFPQIIQANTRLEHTPMLLGLLAFSVALSVLAGYTTAHCARGASRPVAVLALLQLAFGVLFQTLSWHLLPVWYHLTFLALLVPGVVFGGRLRGH